MTKMITSIGKESFFYVIFLDYFLNMVDLGGEREAQWDTSVENQHTLQADLPEQSQTAAPLKVI